MDAHSFAARNFAHLYAVGGRQHSVGAVAKMQESDNLLERKKEWRMLFLCPSFLI